MDLDIRVYVKVFQLKKATDAMKAKIIQQINAYNHLDYHIQEPKYRIEDVPNGVLFSFLRIGKQDFIDDILSSEYAEAAKRNIAEA